VAGAREWANGGEHSGSMKRRELLVIAEVLLAFQERLRYMQLVDYALAGKSRRISAGKYYVSFPFCIPLQLHSFLSTPSCPFPPSLPTLICFVLKQ